MKMKVLIYGIRKEKADVSEDGNCVENIHWQAFVF